MQILKDLGVVEKMNGDAFRVGCPLTHVGVGAVWVLDMCAVFLLLLTPWSTSCLKATAYFKAASVLKQHPHKITSGAQAQKLKGIGKKIAKKIDEILSTVCMLRGGDALCVLHSTSSVHFVVLLFQGHLAKLDKANKDSRVVALKELGRVHGIGPKMAQEL